MVDEVNCNKIVQGDVKMYFTYDIFRVWFSKAITAFYEELEKEGSKFVRIEGEKNTYSVTYKCYFEGCPMLLYATR